MYNRNIIRRTLRRIRCLLLGHDRALLKVDHDQQGNHAGIYGCSCCGKVE